MNKITKTQKLYFCNPSIVIAYEKLNNEALINNLSLFDLYLENFVFKELTTSADYLLDVKLYYYRNNEDVKVGNDEEIINKVCNSLLCYKNLCLKNKAKVDLKKNTWNVNRCWILDKLIVVTAIGNAVYKKVYKNKEFLLYQFKTLMP